jgi:uncharacterized protein (TIGR03083 family)
MQPSELYRGARDRMTQVVAGLDETDLERPVPATPGWRVRDLLAHVVGVPADVVAGNLDGAGSDPWTAVQVQSRTGRSKAELLAEWAVVAPAVEAMLDSVPQMGRIVFDALSHEQDLRSAVDRPGCDAGTLDELADGAVVTLVSLAERSGLPLRIELPDGRTGGPSDAPLTVRPPSGFELFRAVLGRRSAAQVAAWDWSADPSEQLQRGFFLFGPRTDDLDESGPDAG